MEKCENMNIFDANKNTTNYSTRFRSCYSLLQQMTAMFTLRYKKFTHHCSLCAIKLAGVPCVSPIVFNACCRSDLEVCKSLVHCVPRYCFCFNLNVVFQLIDSVWVVFVYPVLQISPQKKSSGLRSGDLGDQLTGILRLMTLFSKCWCSHAVTIRAV